MLRQTLDEYLDGALDTGQAAELERTLATDPAAAGMLARMKAERGLRSAAYQSYAPTRAEASAMAANFMDMATASPIGHVGYWIRRGSAIAAALLLAFGLGHLTAPTKFVTQTVPGQTQIVYNVVYTDGAGNLTVNEFASADERNAFIKQIEKEGATNIAVADITQPGHM